MPLNAARENPKTPIEPQPYVEPPVAPHSRKAAKAAVEVLRALGYRWAEGTGWQKP